MKANNIILLCLAGAILLFTFIEAAVCFAKWINGYTGE
jgi:hypothetical protein